MARCRQCSSAFEVTPFDLALLDKLSPIFGGKKYSIPPPTLCTDCRQQRRLFWRNERALYRRTCDLCKKSVVSMYPAPSPFPVYCTECWWSDSWDPLSFGRDVDFNRPFFPQVKELQNAVPRLALNVINNENSEFINLSGSNKNCYLIFAAEFNEDCLYGYQVIHSVGCTDTADCTESQYCYEVIDVDKCHTVSFSQNCTNCASSAFLFDCKGCTECLLSVNLRNKRNCVRNKQCSPEEYKRLKNEISDQIAQGRLPELLAEFGRMKEQGIHRAREVVNCEQSTGDYIKNCRNAQGCFDVSYAEDCAHIFTGFQIKDLMDVCHTTDAQLGYESLSLGYGSYNTIFTHGSWGSKNLLYCDIIQTGTDMCGCVCMKPAKHCVLNKQYSPAEYEVLVPRVIELMQRHGEWGEFFPAGISPFAYNETTAQVYFPLEATEAKKRGWPWREAQEEPLNVTKTIPAAKLPAAIDDVPDDILNWAITCEATQRPFKIAKKELEFYREHRLPVPYFHPDERHRQRMQKKNPRKLWRRNCMKCKKPVETTYAPERPETVYCEECYLKEVY
ncbi:MAG: hypothetical protein PHX87_02845 [Candidatus Peribacteraceae bacterium]|nr:hypothetical protein [Candidatus Peribacteraceae bacterium]MDD5742346.1 hypothetical protein [Candidatus Peribacteraceae bacterium]